MSRYEQAPERRSGNGQLVPLSALVAQETKKGATPLGMSAYVFKDSNLCTLGGLRQQLDPASDRDRTSRWAVDRRVAAHALHRGRTGCARAPPSSPSAGSSAPGRLLRRA